MGFSLFRGQDGDRVKSIDVFSPSNARKSPLITTDNTDQEAAKSFPVLPRINTSTT